MNDALTVRLEAILQELAGAEPVHDWVLMLGIGDEDEPHVGMCTRPGQNTSITIELLARGAVAVARSQLDRTSDVFSAPPE